MRMTNAVAMDVGLDVKATRLIRVLNASFLKMKGRLDASFLEALDNE